MNTKTLGCFSLLPFTGSFSSWIHRDMQDMDNTDNFWQMILCPVLRYCQWIYWWVFPCLALLVARLFPNIDSPTSLGINLLFPALFLRALGKNSLLSLVTQCLIVICEITHHFFTYNLNSIFIYIKQVLWKLQWKLMWAVEKMTMLTINKDIYKN